MLHCYTCYTVTYVTLLHCYTKICYTCNKLVLTVVPLIRMTFNKVKIMRLELGVIKVIVKNSLERNLIYRKTRYRRLSRAVK